MKVRETVPCALVCAEKLNYQRMTSRRNQRTSLSSFWTDVRGGEWRGCGVCVLHVTEMHWHVVRICSWSAVW